MSTNRLKIVIKGTLESETPGGFEFEPGISASSYTDDSVDDLGAQTEDLTPSTFMFDIAELRLNGKEIGNYRQVITASLATADSDPFFNGSGVVLKNDDPGNGYYNEVELYIRKMIFDNAMVYYYSGASFVYEEPAEVVFHEDDVSGFNFNALQTLSYWDSLRDNYSEVLRIFPLVIPVDGGFYYDRENDETVLEIRIVIKNFIKMYEYDYYDDGIYKVCHFWALSDWLRDVHADEQYMGRNIHAVAKAYVPGKTGTITGTTTADRYVIAIPSGEPISDYYITDTGTNLRDSISSCDFPVAPVYAGVYIEDVLDYYVNYEGYKKEWNDVLATCPDLDTYETAWDGYEASVEGFKIAPYITISDGSGNFSFSNVAPGSYNVYYYTSALSYGSLFVDNTGIDDDTIGFDKVGSTAVTVTAGNTVTVP